MAAALAALWACGGGGGGGGGSSTRGSTGTAWVAGVFLPAANFAAQCAAPRSGIDPATGLRFPDVPGSTLTENNWLRSWTNDLYLWYDEVVDRDPVALHDACIFRPAEDDRYHALRQCEGQVSFHL